MTPRITPQPSDPPPFFETLQQEIERAIDRFRFNPSVRDAALRMGLSGQMIPAVDISETDDLFEITAEVPGVAKDDLDITIRGDVMTLRGQKSSDHGAKEKSYRLTERSYGHFERSIPLGFTPEDDAVKAVFKDGVLKLSIRKPAVSKTAIRKVTINSD